MRPKLWQHVRFREGSDDDNFVELLVRQHYDAWLSRLLSIVFSHLKKGRLMFRSRFISLRALITAVLVSYPGLANAAVVVDQPPISIGNPHGGAVGVASADADIVINKSAAYDDFVLSEPTLISSITWTGAYSEDFDSPESTRGTTDFNLNFYHNTVGSTLCNAQSLNKPDVNNAAASFTLNAGNSGIDNGSDVSKTVFTDRLQRDGGRVVEYQADLAPFTLPAGRYWVSIQSDQVLTASADPEWLWVFGTSGDNRAFSYDTAFGDPVGSEPACAYGFNTAFTLESPDSSILGDFDGSGALEAADIDLLSAEILGGSTDGQYDLNADGNVDSSDHLFWVEDLFGTFLGDANLNREVAFDDFLAMANNYGQSGGWASGDFTGDGSVRFMDFVSLAQNYGLSAAAAASGEPSLVSSVPEPSSSFYVLMVTVCGITMIRRSGRKSLDVAVVGIKVWGSR